MSANTAAATVECIIPVLRVTQVDESIRYYTDILGFKVDWHDTTIASVSRDGHAVMLSEGAHGHAGTWVWIGVEDIEPLFDQLTAKGVKILEKPTNYPWAYQMKIVDPDGHVLWIGSDPK